MPDSHQLLQDYIRHMSISADAQHTAGMEGARNFISKFLKQLGFKIQIIKTQKHPIVLAHRKAPKSNRKLPHILLYGHYDVQPVDPLNLWQSPPFAPQVRNGRLYGRGAADNKGPQLAMLIGLAHALKKNPKLPLELTVLIEGEEEIGSPSFPEFLKKYKDKLQADFILVSDTCSPSVDQIVVTTGLRGLCGLEVTLHGPQNDLHSGLHGGAVLNPIQALTEICSSLHKPNGLVNVPGFYTGVKAPSDWERTQLKKLPITTKQYQKFLGVPAFHTPPAFTPFEATRFLPTLEFNGIGGGYQGPGSKTIIPTHAFTKITCRLVANQEPDAVLKKVIKAIKARCPKGVRLEIKTDHGGEPYFVTHPAQKKKHTLNPYLAKAFDLCDQAIAHSFGKRPLFLREGGSIPIIGQMKTILGLDTLMIGLFTPEDLIHAPNESMSLDLYQKGIEAYEQLFLSL